MIDHAPPRYKLNARRAITSGGHLPGETTVNKGLRFLLSTLVGGAVVLVPLFLVGITFAAIGSLLVKVGTPLGELFFPKGTFDHPALYVPFGIFLLLLLCFLIGLSLKIPLFRSAGKWLRTRLLSKLPGYEVARRMAQAFTGTSDQMSFKPALLLGDAGIREIAYIIEDHGDGNLTVMLPEAPNPFSGPVKIVPRDHVQLLNVPLKDFVAVIAHWGDGLSALIHPESQDPSTQSSKPPPLKQ